MHMRSESLHGAHAVLGNAVPWLKYVCVLTDYYSPDMKAVKIDQEVLGELIKLVIVYIVKWFYVSLLC